MPPRNSSPARRRLDPCERIGRLPRRVRAERKPRTRLLERAPRVGLRGDPRPVFIGQLAIGDGMDRLHRGDHADPRKALHVFRVNALGVLDAWPPATPRFSMRRQRVERPTHGAITDGMEAYVQPGA